MPINLASSASVFAAIEGAAYGKLKKVHSENVAERIVRVSICRMLYLLIHVLQYLNDLLISVEQGVVAHPIRTMLMLFGVAALVIMVLRRVFADDYDYATARREWEKDKGRMD